jgi:hypothetical protein
MVYTKPTRSTSKKRRKRLTIGNTDKYNNYKSITNDDLNNMVVINAKNVKLMKAKIEKQLNEGKDITNIMYRYDNIKSEENIVAEDDLIELLDMGINITYHVLTGSISDKLLNALGSATGTTQILYTLENSYKETVSNLVSAHEATKVVFDVSLILPDMTTADVIKYFSPYATNIDEVQIDIPNLTTKEIMWGNSDIVEMRKAFYLYLPDNLWHCYTKNKYNVFKALERPFSGWGTYLTMVCTNKEEKKALDKMVADKK